MTTLTLISRTYCHLCADMEQALLPLLGEYGARLEIVDVDADAELEALYGERVPVLLHDGRELCHYFVEDAKIRDFLGNQGRMSDGA